MAMTCTKENYRIGHSINTYDISEGGVYCSHWGLVDLYPQCEKNLRELLDLGKDFRTKWCGSKKELLSARYSRIGSTFLVEVEAWMDDLWDGDALIYDAIYDVLHDEEKYPMPLSAQERLRAVENDGDDEFIDGLRDMSYGIEDDVVVEKSFPAVDAHYDTIMDVVSKLEDEADDVLKKYYEQICWNVVYYAQYC